MVEKWPEVLNNASNEHLALVNRNGAGDASGGVDRTGNQLQALFNFPHNRYIFLGLAQESADAINFGLNQLPSIPGEGQWVNFLRHHDELNLSRMTNEQRQQVFTAFGPEPEMQIFDRGLRRRLAPMLDGDMARIKMAYSVLFSLPGASMVYYGEERSAWASRWNSKAG